MRPSGIEQCIKTIFSERSDIVPYIEGAPGGGKTSVATKIGSDMGIPRENILIFRPSLRDPVDLLGTPRNDGTVTRWIPPSELYQLRQGRWLLVLDELADACNMMQNGLCGLVLDRFVGEVQLSPNVFIIATGNRTKDKSGANRIVSKLGNRVMRLEYEEHLDDFKSYAFRTGMATIVSSFLNFRPGLLSAFDPDVFSSPTPRQWEKVSFIPRSLPSDLYLGCVTGLVGPGAATEFAAFARLEGEMPDPDACISNPTKAPVPVKRDVLYALIGAISNRASEQNIDNVAKYIDRVPTDIQVVGMNDIQLRVPTIKKTRAFRDWAVANADVLL